MDTLKDPMENQEFERQWANAVDIYNISRKKIVDEDTIVNHRLTWIILSNGIYLALAGTVLN